MSHGPSVVWAQLDSPEVAILAHSAPKPTKKTNEQSSRTALCVRCPVTREVLALFLCINCKYRQRRKDQRLLHAATPKHPRHLVLLLLPITQSRLHLSSTSTLQTTIQSHAIFPPNPRNDFLDLLDSLLQHCCTTVGHCRQVHCRFIATGTHQDSAFLAARLVSAYARLGWIFDAQKVFESAVFGFTSNLLLWNSILRANVGNGWYESAVRLYVRMQKLGVLGDGFTLPSVIKACAHLGHSDLCRIVHGHVLGVGLRNNLHVDNELVGMYSKLGRMEDARNVFDGMSVRNHVSWNIMVSGYSLNYDCDGAVEMFRRMESEGLEPNIVTWTSLLSSLNRCGRVREAMEFFSLMRMRGIEVNAEAVAVVLSVCADLGAFDVGKAVHGCVIRCGLEGYAFVMNSLIYAYGKCGDVSYSRKLFMEMENKNIVSWNALITAYAETGLCDEAIEVFSQLDRLGGCPSFRPNVVSWSAIIDAFASKEQWKESLELFRQMQLANILANAVTISTVLAVCAESAALNNGREIHGHVIRAFMDHNILVGNGLVNMYTKCGCLKEGHSVFEKIERKDIISWNSMITGYGMHGLGLNALETFDQMIRSGSKPDSVTFVALLSACSHAGLVLEGRRLFTQMVQHHIIEPQMEHYACMVDLLGRAGLLQEASQIVESMPMEPNACVWGALLNSCRIHKNTEVAEETASRIFTLNSETTGSHMLLSNIYAARGKWDDSAKVRASARLKGLKKTPGQSWIELKKNVYMFSAGQTLIKGLEEVYGILEELALQMESYGSKPDYSSVTVVGDI